MSTSQVITDDGKKIMLDRLWNSSPTRLEPSQFKVGVGIVTATVSDTDLTDPVPIADTEAVDDCDATTSWADSADMTISLNNSTFKEGTGSLNLTKDGTATVNANTAKTTTSRDFTSKELSIWIYVDDQTTLDLFATTDCLTIRFGSSSGNYSQWTKDKSDFSVGWNLFDTFTTANRDSETGTHDIASSDYTLVQLTTAVSGSTWAAGKVIMDDIKVISSGDYTKGFLTSFPVLDFNNFQATVRTILLTTDANGNAISEFGLFNIDGTPLLFSKVVFTPIDKTSSLEITFVEKNKIT